jgi:predicted TPR repeat methyltransferase
MPTSDPQGKDWALQTYLKIRPQLVVDIGPGEGTYAKLMRPHHKAKSWTAIEAWAPYVTTYGLDEMYDRVIVADVNYVYFEALKSDLVIAGDVLEHMEAEDARSLLSRITMLAKNALISIPVLHLDQDAVNGNPFERHIDHWTYEAMLDELQPGVVDTWHGDVLAYYWWKRP